MVGTLADAIAPIDARRALELAAISESNAIAAFSVFDVRSFTDLVSVVDQLGLDALEAARSRAASMSYDDALHFVYDVIEQLRASAAHKESRGAG